MMTPELHGIIRYLANTGVTFKITDVDTPGVHAPGSYHYQGLALDLAGKTPSRDSPELLAIFAAFCPVESQLAELFYLGAPYNIKDGKRIRPIDKDNHVHVAVPKGTILAKEASVPTEIPADRKIINAFPFQDGYVFVFADGAVITYGCEFKGRPTWDGQNWQQ